MNFKVGLSIVVGLFWGTVLMSILKWIDNRRRPARKPSRWKRNIGPIEAKGGILPLALSPSIRGNRKRPRLPHDPTGWHTAPTAQDIYGDP